MAYIKRTWVNDETELSAENMNHIEDGIENSYGVRLKAVQATAPEECYIGDQYFNTTTNLIYTAVENNLWGETGKSAITGVFYIVFDSQTVYAYNGTTLISVGGGAGGGGDSTPIGTIEAYAGSTAPDGYLLCNGSAVSRTTYKDLYNVIGTTYGSGDGNTTFNLPDIKGKVVVMLDANDTDFDTLGETGGSKELQSAGTGNSGNLQPYIVLNYIIKVQKLSAETVLSEQLPVGTEVDFDGDSTDIPVGWEEIDNPEEYSTSEVKTNKIWIDGKPVYRKVITGITMSSGTGIEVVHNISNIDEFTDLKSRIKSTGNGVFIGNQYYNSLIFFSINANVLSKRIYYDVAGSALIGTLDVIIEYTKTTD